MKYRLVDTANYSNSMHSTLMRAYKTIHTSHVQRMKIIHLPSRIVHCSFVSICHSFSFDVDALVLPLLLMPWPVVVIIIILLRYPCVLCALSTFATLEPLARIARVIESIVCVCVCAYVCLFALDTTDVEINIYT